MLQNARPQGQGTTTLWDSALQTHSKEQRVRYGVRLGCVKGGPARGLHLGPCTVRSRLVVGSKCEVIKAAWSWKTPSRRAQKQGERGRNTQREAPPLEPRTTAAGLGGLGHFSRQTRRGVNTTPPGQNWAGSHPAARSHYRQRAGRQGDWRGGRAAQGGPGGVGAPVVAQRRRSGRGGRGGRRVLEERRPREVLQRGVGGVQRYRLEEVLLLGAAEGQRLRRRRGPKN